LENIYDAPAIKSCNTKSHKGSYILYAIFFKCYYMHRSDVTGVNFLMLDLCENIVPIRNYDSRKYLRTYLCDADDRAGRDLYYLHVYNYVQYSL
jgi:hypothetical protein